MSEGSLDHFHPIRTVVGLQPGVVNVLVRVDVNLDAGVVDEAGVCERLHVGDVEVGDPELSLNRAHLQARLPRLQLVLERRPIDLLERDEIQ